jgi:hypothetical protein
MDWQWIFEGVIFFGQVVIILLVLDIIKHLIRRAWRKINGR